MTQLQRKLAWSWLVGGVTLLISAYILKTMDAYEWVIPMFIGMPIVRYLRYGIDNDKNSIFHFMSEKMKLYSAIYLVFLAALVAYFLMVSPEVVGNNVGIFLVLTMAPAIIVAIKIDLKLFLKLGE